MTAGLEPAAAGRRRLSVSVERLSDGIPVAAHGATCDYHRTGGVTAIQAAVVPRFVNCDESWGRGHPREVPYLP